MTENQIKEFQVNSLKTKEIRFISVEDFIKSSFIESETNFISSKDLYEIVKDDVGVSAKRFGIVMNKCGFKSKSVRSKDFVFKAYFVDLLKT